MRVVYFGTYERHYPRNAQVISCLRGAGVTVVERHLPLWEAQEHKFSPGLRTLAKAAVAQSRLMSRSLSDADVVIVGYPGHLDMAAAKRPGRSRPVVFNALVSLEDTLVDDRQVAKPGSLVGRALRWIDRAAFRAADLVVADTKADGDYFSSRFGIPRGKVAVCFVGAEDRLFRPGPSAQDDFEALFVGKLIPLHGLETILAAAARCPEIAFRVVGSGQMQSLLAAAPRNVVWTRWVEYERLPALYRSAGCALGIFGLSDKAARVIPNKAFQALATGAPLVTRDSPAARELLEDGRDALLVPPGDPDALAEAVRRLARDPELRRRIGVQGRHTYEREASELALGERWRSVLEQVVRASGARAG